MRRTRRLKITTVERQSAQVQPLAIRARCPVCEREVETLAKAQAAEVLEIDEATLTRLIAASRVHTMQTVSGSLRVCKDSLFIMPARHTEDTKRGI